MIRKLIDVLRGRQQYSPVEEVTIEKMVVRKGVEKGDLDIIPREDWFSIAIRRANGRYEVIDVEGGNTIHSRSLSKEEFEAYLKPTQEYGFSAFNSSRKENQHAW